MIITGGEHVFPSEVENVICQHEMVFDAAVIGVPHDKWGEQVHAVVILKEGCSCRDADLMDFCRDRLAGFKRPKSVQFISPEEMPRTGTGKILHRILRERCSKYSE
jgi:fatty-acyl-CoA synthase